MASIERIYTHDSVISLEDFHSYFDVFSEAWDVHKDREAVRTGLWKEYPAQDQMWQVKVKTDRVLRILGDDKATDVQIAAAIKEFPDIINYTNFAARIMKGEVG